MAEEKTGKKFYLGGELVDSIKGLKIVSSSPGVLPLVYLTDDVLTNEDETALDSSCEVLKCVLNVANIDFKESLIIRIPEGAGVLRHGLVAIYGVKND